MITVHQPSTWGFDAQGNLLIREGRPGPAREGRPGPAQQSRNAHEEASSGEEAEETVDWQGTSGTRASEPMSYRARRSVYEESFVLLHMLYSLCLVQHEVIMF